MLRTSANVCKIGCATGVPAIVQLEFFQLPSALATDEFQKTVPRPQGNRTPSLQKYEIPKVPKPLHRDLPAWSDRSRGKAASSPRPTSP